MSSKTKIIVLHMKEVIYTIIFLILAVILGILLFFMFGPGKSLVSSSPYTDRYTPGIYRTSVNLNNNNFDVEVTVDANRIQSISLVNLSESTAAMFPLMEPALNSLATQIYSLQTTENLQYTNEQKYTSELLIHAIDASLEKAAVPMS